MNGTDIVVSHIELSRKKIKFLKKSIDLFAESVPELSKVYGRKLLDLQDVSQSYLSSLCASCGIKFRIDNHSVRIKPKLKQSKKIQKLKRKQEMMFSNLGKFQQKLLSMYEDGTAKIVITCNSCQNKQVLHGESRNERKSRKKSSQKPVITPIANKKRKKQKRKADDSLLDLSVTSLDFTQSSPALTSTPKAALFAKNITTESTKLRSRSKSGPATMSQKGSPYLTLGSRGKKKGGKGFHDQLKKKLQGSKEKSEANTSLQDFLSSL